MRVEAFVVLCFISCQQISSNHLEKSVVIPCSPLCQASWSTPGLAPSYTTAKSLPAAKLLELSHQATFSASPSFPVLSWLSACLPLCLFRFRIHMYCFCEKRGSFSLKKILLLMIVHLYLTSANKGKTTIATTTAVPSTKQLSRHKDRDSYACGLVGHLWPPGVLPAQTLKLLTPVLHH